MEILKCNADFDKVYYVEYRGTLRQCRLVRTQAGNPTNRYTPVYVLDVAGVGEVVFAFPRQQRFDTWYRTSRTPSILYESIEDYRKGKPIEDNYGSTGNAYNCRFIEPLFRYHSPCNCGGDTYTWRWNGVKAVCYSVDMSGVYWTWDRNGFHCALNDSPDADGFRTRKECEDANKVEVVKFKEDDAPARTDLMDTSNNHTPELVERINKAYEEKPDAMLEIVRFLAKRDNEETILAKQDGRDACHDYCQHCADDADLLTILSYCRM